MMTLQEFREATLSLIKKYEIVYKRSLEEYLRSLLARISERDSKTLSYTFFLKILEEAFQTSPPTLDEDWSKYSIPPPNRLQLAILDAKSKTLNLPSLESRMLEGAPSDFESLHLTLLFQIAELRRFAEKRPEEYGKYASYAANFKYYGLQSPTGHSWSNWDPFTYLECATAGLMDHSKWLPSEFVEGNSWAVLACLLEWGREYE